MSEPTRTHPPDPNSATLTRPDAGADGDGELVAPPGYEFLGEVGRGGMGVVYRARDLDLGREVAVKVLLPQYGPDSPTARRFVDEARITGRLQHPGIPAVYRVGACADGRPFLAMKLIGGRTLDELLKERTAPPCAEPPPASTGVPGDYRLAAEGMLDRLAAVLEHGRFLAVFEQVCQAVGYAHKQGVIHRDLKPANVMVGDFGEVQVMDWGIARSGDRRPEVKGEAAEPAATVEYSPHADLRTPQSDLTQAGAILGTPAFMPPEQAIGAVDQVGKHSDVFGLGAILCVVLTGKPPYAAEDAESNRQLAARAKLDDCFARLDACGAEPGLVALCKRCLAAEPKDRPRDAREVADAVAAFRADAERRARQAEMDRARTEVRVTEERKRRRIQRILALAILGLLLVTGYTIRRIDVEQTRQRREQEARERQRETEQKEHEAALHAQQLATERDVIAALNEVQVLREEGWKQADDTGRWALTITAARSSLKRAESLLASGEPTDALRDRVVLAGVELGRDARDRALLAELDRIGEENDVRFLIPVALSRGPSDRYAAAFRAHGIDLLAIPREEAVAWLNGHRFRDRLTAAVRNWQLAYPPFDAPDPDRIRSAPAVAAVGGGAGVAALLHRPSPRDRLGALLGAITGDPFAREWWAAVARNDSAALKKLLTRPELGRMSSRELSSLADGLAGTLGRNEEVLADFLRLAYDRFPGEFWVNFRIASTLNSKHKNRRAETIRHLNAAVAARPQSAIARVALGAELHERRKDDPAGLRMIRAAAELDPTSPWPHFVLGMMAMEAEDFTNALKEFEQTVRADPDTGFLMIQPFLSFIPFSQSATPRKFPPAAEVARTIDRLIAARPDHPGGYDLRAEFLLKKGDGRAALADYRKAKTLMRPDYPRRVFIDMQLDVLEPLARWEEKLPAVLRGEIKPASAAEFAELAGYCAKFEKKYALAARFAGQALGADPKLREDWVKVGEFAGWSVKAAGGHGTDAADLTPDERSRLRRQALSWLREAVRQSQGASASVLGYLFLTNPDLALLRSPVVLAKLPPEERADWEKFWREVAPPEPKPKKSEVAPPPRPVK